jgi:hypothetical protein
MREFVDRRWARRASAGVVVWLVLAGWVSAQSAVNTALLSSASCPGTGCLTLSVSGVGGVGVQVSGTFSGTLTFEGSVDGITYAALNLTPINSSTGASTTTTTGVWSGGVGGLAIVRVRMSSYTSGTAVVTIQNAPTSARGGGGGGSGTVTSIATTSPITGGTITGTGTIACATCIAGSLSATQIPYGTGSNTVAGDDDFAFDGTSFTLYNFTPVTTNNNLVLIAPVHTQASDSGSQLTSRSEYFEFHTDNHTLPAYIAAATVADFYGGSTTVSGAVQSMQGITYLESGTFTGLPNGLEGSIATYGGTAANISAVYGSVGTYNGSTITGFATGFWADIYNNAINANFAGYYTPALGGKAPNAYSFWADEQGVFRIRSDNTFNSLYQAIPAGYNTQVLKYTPGAKAYERWALQWESNVAVLTTEAGPTQTLTSVTSASTTATATLVGHGYRTGDSVVVAGANQSEYNGTYTVTRVSDNVFTYTFAGSVTTPATGTITAQSGTLRAMQIGDANVPVLVSDLKNTGSAGSKKVVCVDTSTGRLYASSTGTDCSN